MPQDKKGQMMEIRDLLMREELVTEFPKYKEDSFRGEHGLELHDLMIRLWSSDSGEIVIDVFAAPDVGAKESLERWQEAKKLKATLEDHGFQPTFENEVDPDEIIEHFREKAEEEADTEE